jgi:hypothetical protein
MNVKKIALCLCAVTLSTQLAAKDLAEEKEVACWVRTELALSINSKVKETGASYYDETQRMALTLHGMRWGDTAKAKYLEKLKVAETTFASAQDRVEETENAALEKHLGTLDLSIGEAAIRKEVFKFRLNRMKLLGCLGNANPVLYKVAN